MSDLSNVTPHSGFSSDIVQPKGVQSSLHQAGQDRLGLSPLLDLHGLEYLSQETVSAFAMGKAILLGEHSVVYGQPALAVALPGLTLKLSLIGPEFSTSIRSSVTAGASDICSKGTDSLDAKWEDSWILNTVGSSRMLDLKQRVLLTRCLDYALRESALGRGLADFRPQPVRIDGQFPLGAGLGGSAALCVAAVRLADQLAAVRLGTENSLVSLNERMPSLLARAHRLDNLFHGTASGVDTATVLSGGLIECGAGRTITPLENKKSFYLALVDSGTRSETAAMVQKVRELKRCQPVYVDEKIARLGEIARCARGHLATGEIGSLGKQMNEAHEHLRDLGLSTPDLDRITKELMECGALGAKLTGSGGGGFALGLFREYPHWVMDLLPVKGSVYVSEVPMHHFGHQ